jgi:hypothetical protein
MKLSLNGLSEAFIRIDRSDVPAKGGGVVYLGSYGHDYGL